MTRHSFWDLSGLFSSLAMIIPLTWSLNLLWPSFFPLVFFTFSYHRIDKVRGGSFSIPVYVPRSYSTLTPRCKNLQPVQIFF